MTSNPLRPLVFAAFSLTAACGQVVIEGSGGGGSGGTGVGGTTPENPPEACEPGTQEACYSGPDGTADVGACHAGIRVCDSQTATFSACIGEVTPGAEVCWTEADETCDDGESACTGELRWAREGAAASAGGAGADIAADRWGNVLVTGRFDESFDVAGLTLAADGYDAFVLKLDGAGNGLWARQAHGGAGSAIASDGAGNVYVAGAFNGTVDLGGGKLASEDSSDVFVAKYSPDGELLRSSRFGGAGYQWPEKIAVDAAGNMVIIGGLHDGANLGEGYQPAIGETDFFVMKLDPSGERLWSKHFGSKGNDHGHGVTFDAEGAVLITGSFDGTLDLGGDALTTAGADDVFLARLSPAGAHVFSRRFGGDGHDLGRGIAVDPSDGTIAIAGLFSSAVDFGGGMLAAKGGYDAFLARYDGTGAFFDSQGFGGAGAETYATDVAIDGAGNTVIFGFLSGTASFGGEPLSAGGSATGSNAEDVFVAKYDPIGQHLHSHVFGDAARQRAYGLAVDGAGSALLTGDFQGKLDFGSGPLAAPAPDGWDLFIAKLAP